MPLPSNPFPSDHLLRPNPLVELFRRDVPQRERGRLERGALPVRLLRDLRRLVVADVRVERGDEHERILQELGDALAPRLDAGSTRLNSSHVSISYAVF